MALDLKDNVLNQTEQRLDFNDLMALTEGMSKSELDDFWSGISVQSFGDERFNNNGELVIGPITPPTKFQDFEPAETQLSLNDKSSSAYPLKLNTENKPLSGSSETVQNSAASSAQGDSWEVQTINGPATSYVDPSERTMLYTDENGNPVYNNVDGDYLYDDYNGNPVYYDTGTAIANGADAYVYNDNGVVSNVSSNGTSGGLGGLAGNVGDALNGLLGGSNKGSKAGGTGAQVGETTDVEKTRLTKPSTDASDYAALDNYTLIVNRNLIDKVKWEYNPLDKYTTYTYKLEWFAIDLNHYRAYQDSEKKIDYLKKLSEDDKFYIFRTGINSDVSIESFDVKSYYGTNSVYKNVIFTELHMTVHEPSGASLLEVIKEIAAHHGYINMANMPYFMKITYLGYVGDGSDNDGIQEVLAGYETYIPFYISRFVPTINFDTKYEITGHPLSVLAVLKENFVLKTDISIDIPSGSNLGDMLEAIGKEVNRQYIESCTEITHELYKIANRNSTKVYQYAGESISTAIYIDVDPDISKISIDNNKVKSQFPELANNGVALSLRFSVGTSLNKIFDEVRKIISFSSIVYGNIFEDSTGATATPQDWANICKTFSFIPEIKYVGQDPETFRIVNSFTYRLFQKYNPTYMPPFDSIQDKDQAKINKAKYRAYLCNQILEEKSLIKRYDGYNTGMNDQVINVNINMDNLFFVQLPTKGLQNPSSNVKTSTVSETPYDSNQREIINPSQLAMDVINENANSTGMPTQFITSNVYGRNASGDSVSGSDRALNSIYNEIYRSGGMIQLALTIKGDPYWISNYALLRNTLEDVEDDKTCHFKNGLLHLYFKTTLPRVTQDYHNDPDDGESVYSGVVNKTISGVYTVVSVTSRFNSGLFTQVVDCVMNSNLPMEFNGNIINFKTMPTYDPNDYQSYQYESDPINQQPNNYVESLDNPPNLKKTALGNSPLPEGSFAVSSGFGSRVAPTPGASTSHNGIDLAAKTGTPVYAAGNGKVTDVGYGTKSGRYVKIQHDDGYESVYLHMSGTNVKPGQTINGGTQIGNVGNTGISTGSHLHFGVKKDGEWIDPKNLV